MQQDLRREDELDWDGNEQRSGEERRSGRDRRDEIRFEPNKANRRKNEGRREEDEYRNIWKKRS